MASEERVKAFVAFLSGNPKLHEELKSANSLEEAIAIARANGFEDPEELLSAEQDVVNLRDEELETVAGGLLTLVGPPKVTCPLTCWCK